MLRKGVYSYEYVDSMKKSNESKLHPKVFYSALYDEDISDEDYQHAQTIWKEYNITPMKDYHNLHSKSDVLLLVTSLRTLETVA